MLGVEGAERELFPEEEHDSEGEATDDEARSEVGDGDDRGVSEEIILNAALAGEVAVRDDAQEEHAHPEEESERDRHRRVNADLGDPCDPVREEHGEGAEHDGADNQRDHVPSVGAEHDDRDEEGEQRAGQRGVRDDVADERLFAQVGEAAERAGDEPDAHRAEEHHPVGVVAEDLYGGHVANSRKWSSPPVTS